MAKWKCEWCSDRAAEVASAKPSACKLRYCPKCRGKTWHAPFKET